MNSGGGTVPPRGELQPVTDQPPPAAGDGAGDLGHTDDAMVQLHLKAGQHGGLHIADDLLGIAGLIGENMDLSDRTVFQTELHAQYTGELSNQLFPGQRAGVFMDLCAHAFPSNVKMDYK